MIKSLLTADIGHANSSAKNLQVCLVFILSVSGFFVYFVHFFIYKNQDIVNKVHCYLINLTEERNKTRNYSKRWGFRYVL